MATLQITAGWTEPLDFQLMKSDAPINLAGYTVELVLKSSSGASDTTADVSIVDSSTGTVRYTPDPADLAVGQYTARFKVTAPDGSVSYFPNARADTWIVYAE